MESQGLLGVGQRNTFAFQWLYSEWYLLSSGKVSKCRKLFLACVLWWRCPSTQPSHGVSISTVSWFSVTLKHFPNSCLPDLLIHMVASNAAFSFILLHRNSAMAWHVFARVHFAWVCENFSTRIIITRTLFNTKITQYTVFPTFHNYS